MNQKKNYVSIQNKAEQVYRIHLAQIEFNKKSNLIKKIIQNYKFLKIN